MTLIHRLERVIHPASNWLERRKKGLSEHLGFWTAFFLAVLCISFIPQIRNVGFQALSASGPYYLYWICVLALLILYVTSLFVVLWPFPLQGAQEWLERKVEQLWGLACSWPAVFRLMVYALLSPVWISESICRWLVSAAFHKIPCAELDPPLPGGMRVPREGNRCFSSLRRHSGKTGMALAAMGLVVISGYGALPDACRIYPLAGAFCRTSACLALLIGVWLLAASGQACWSRHHGRTEAPPGTIIEIGRVLGWFTASFLLGELLWVAAWLDGDGFPFSYRLYTIWAVFHLLWTVIGFALLVDRLNAETRIPWRVFAITGSVLVLLRLAGPFPFEPDACERHLVGTTTGPPKTAETPEQELESWMEGLRARIQTLDGPVVVIAASGGGSRAAIFTALSLELLSRTPLNPDSSLIPGPLDGKQQRTWADNIVLSSSVSGGSLATAYFLTHLQPNRIAPAIEGLRNTAHGDLVNGLRETIAQLKRNVETEKEKEKTAGNGGGDDIHGKALTWAARFVEAILASDASAGEKRDFTAGFPALEEDSRRLGWTLQSGAFDAMCTDFMAPILRGILTPAFDRGESLRVFWTQQFGWGNFSNHDGLPGPRDGLSVKPCSAISIFNTTDITTGSRFAIGFPALPRNLWHDGTWNDIHRADLERWKRPTPLGEFDPERRLCLSHAVRMASNFPWGFRVLNMKNSARDLPATQQKSVRLLDGGVVDNTGLDTIFYVFHTLDVVASQGEKDKKLQSIAGEVLRLIRQRGLAIIEIDAGAKPDEESPAYPFHGVSEPLQALNNAVYTNAERARQFYVSETRKILDRSLLRELESAVSGRRRREQPSSEKLPEIMQHIILQCNHYQPGDGSRDPAVMTAWSLGPYDKANILGRFLAEIAVWDENRRDAAKVFHRSSSEQGLLSSLWRIRDLEKGLGRQVSLTRQAVDRKPEAMKELKGVVKANAEMYGSIKTLAPEGQKAIKEEAGNQARALAALAEKDEASVITRLEAKPETEAQDLNKLPMSLERALEEMPEVRAESVQQLIRSRAEKSRKYYGSSRQAAE